ncbi:hypothetical protein T265_10580 [Opisthorchis viverrini]|uniref:Uncharacterized protein n=1 Tax=Opisthorchis viverrini TaxID=6198 RepID=A0A074Z627_OPIVI|nr:hypothetical protein T265_10580 [Opisthorchis viverrini]KER21007.1 hypothetical protein T265_10580 [Opisthorchis viverrini]
METDEDRSKFDRHLFSVLAECSHVTKQNNCLSGMHSQCEFIRWLTYDANKKKNKHVEDFSECSMSDGQEMSDHFTPIRDYADVYYSCWAISNSN